MPILLCNPQIRPHTKRLTERNFPTLTVISYSEIAPKFKVRSLGTVTITKDVEERGVITQDSEEEESGQQDDDDQAVAEEEPVIEEQERICRKLDNKDGLANSLGNQANILYSKGNLPGALMLLKEVERICRKLDNKQQLARSLADQANLLAQEMKRPREALPLAEEAYQLANDYGLTALARRIKPILDAIVR